MRRGRAINMLIILFNIYIWNLFMVSYKKKEVSI